MPRSRSFTSKLYRVALIASLAGFGLFGSFGLAGVASADVLVNAPSASVCAGSSSRVGVWYQSFSGGPRAYWVEEFGPSGKLLLNRFGDSATTWTFWNVRTTNAGVYRTVYVTPSGLQGYEYTLRTVARAC